MHYLADRFDKILRCTRARITGRRVRDCVAGRLAPAASLWIEASFILMAGCDGRLAQCENDSVGMRLIPQARPQDPIPATTKETK